MAKVGEKKGTVCAVVDQAILADIEARRDPLTLSRSAYVGLILQKWVADGCPPVSSADSAVQQMRQRTERK